MEKLSIMPKWNELFLPVINYYSDGKVHNNRKAKIEIADSLNLEEELRQMVNNKYKDNKIENRVGWALSALKIAGLLEQYERGSFIITDMGKKLLENLPSNLNEKFLIDNYPLYKQNVEKNKSNYQNRKNNKNNMESDSVINDYTPIERIDDAIIELEQELSTDLMEKLHNIDPYRFEEIVADLLTKMGYGDLEVTKKSNDGGIDAIVNEDKLGLDKIFVQAKRYAEKNLVTEKYIRDFLGALSAQKVQKGIFVTTSFFDKRAIMSAKNSDKKIRLIDKDELAALMIEYEIGTSKIKSYDIKIVDTDYFDN